MIPRRIPRSALCALVTIAAGLSQAGVANAGLTVDKTRVQVGDDYVVTASTDVDVSIWGNRYEIGIYNDQGNLVHSCGPRQSTCVMGVTAKWNNPDNYRPKSPIKYSATLVDTWQGQNVDLGTVAVSVLPHCPNTGRSYAIDTKYSPQLGAEGPELLGFAVSISSANAS